MADWIGHLGFRIYRSDIPNLPRSLKGAGYRTGLIGKLHVNPASAFPFDSHKIASANFQRSQLEQYAREAKDFFLDGDGPFFLSVNYPDAHKPWINRIGGLPKDLQTEDDVQVMPYMGITSDRLRELVAGHYNCMSRRSMVIY